jgi:hypothetical protein
MSHLTLMRKIIHCSFEKHGVGSARGSHCFDANPDTDPDLDRHQDQHGNSDPDRNQNDSDPQHYSIHFHFPVQPLGPRFFSYSMQFYFPSSRYFVNHAALFLSRTLAWCSHF